MKTCDYCGRENTDDTAHCRECGTRFASEDDPLLSKTPARVAAEKKIFSGASLCFAGILVTLLAWFSVVPSPFFRSFCVFMGGLVLFGAWRICRGLVDRDRELVIEETACDALSRDTKLKAKGTRRLFRNVAAAYAIVVPTVSLVCIVWSVETNNWFFVSPPAAVLIFISSFATGFFAPFGRSVPIGIRALLVVCMLVSAFCGGLSALFLFLGPGGC